jgi:hypothetical protein
VYSLEGNIMAAGDVTVQIIVNDATDVVDACADMRVTANDHFAITEISNGNQILVAHIEESP